MLSFILWLVATAISFAMYMLTPKKKQSNATPGTIEQSDVNMAKEGDYIVKVWHRRWVQNATVGFFGNVNTIPIRRNSGGKKG